MEQYDGFYTGHTPEPLDWINSDQQPAVALWLLNSINNQLRHYALRNATHVKC